MTFSVFKPGARVRLRPPDEVRVDAQVVSVHINPNLTITYTVVWWSGGTRNVSDVEAFELEAVKPPNGTSDTLVIDDGLASSAAPGPTAHHVRPSDGRRS